MDVRHRRCQCVFQVKVGIQVCLSCTTQLSTSLKSNDARLASTARQVQYESATSISLLTSNSPNTNLETFNNKHDVSKARNSNPSHASGPHHYHSWPRRALKHLEPQRSFCIRRTRPPGRHNTSMVHLRKGHIVVFIRRGHTSRW